ncbi:MAG: putative lipid biosynthesis lauroyl acyltransferase [Ilumatobacteraceae bacterium]|nr:putative lipid biosynthesis lauroyl acyltransferase [Ilumatobacteraceae bacterium]
MTSMRGRESGRAATPRIAPRRPPVGRGPTAARVLAHVIDAAAAAGSRLPARASHVLAVFGGDVEWAVRPRKRRVLAINLGHAIGAPATSVAVRRLVRAEIVNEAHRSADLLWSIGRPDELMAHVELVGIEHAVGAAARGRGVVLAGLHLGGWEVATSVPAAVVPVPTTVIVADDWLAWAMQHVRVAKGLRLASGPSAAFQAARALRRGEALLVLGDDATQREPRLRLVRFCDAAARLPGGVVTLAQISGAAIVPWSVIALGPRRWRIRFEPMIAAPARDAGEEAEVAVLQELADVWTAMIRAHPDQWAASFPIAWEPLAAGADDARA